MHWDFESAYERFMEGNRSKMLTRGLKGLEQESQRITPSGGLALTPHPAVFGDKLENPYITTDFSESQLELITPPFKNASDVTGFLEKLQKEAENGLEGELLWPLSMPPRLPDEEFIPVARFGDTHEGREKEAYRNGLALRYGKKMQMISGIHYNYSFDPDLLDYLYDVYGKGGDRRDFNNRTYFAVIRNYMRYRWLLVYLFGASPVADITYDPVVSHELNAVAKCCPECCDCAGEYERYSTSLRVSRFGYSNDKKRTSGIRFKNLEEYVGGIRRLLSSRSGKYGRFGVFRDGRRVQLNDNVLQKESEFYSSIRPKQNIKKGETQLDALEERGVGYLEVRILDLDPFGRTGAALQELRFLEVFMMFCLFEKSSGISEKEYEKINKNHNITALYGRKPGVLLYRYDAGKSGICGWGGEIFEKLRLIADLMDKGAKHNDFRRSVEGEYEKLTDPSRLPSSRIIAEMSERGESFIEFGVRRAIANSDEGLSTTGRDLVLASAIAGMG